jgi:hypothetical protein
MALLVSVSHDARNQNQQRPPRGKTTGWFRRSVSQPETETMLAVSVSPQS